MADEKKQRKKLTRVITGPAARKELIRTMHPWARAAAATLGPRANTVCLEDRYKQARLIVTQEAIPVIKHADVPQKHIGTGAQLLKQAMTQLHKERGDGVATMCAMLATSRS